jgi:hypothetical protein
MTPTAAGALRLGQVVPLGDAPAAVTDLFLSRVGKVEGATNWPAGTALYGFSASGVATAMVARWNETAITFYRTAPITQKNPAKEFH